MSTKEATATIVSELLREEPDFKALVERIIAGFEEGKSLRDATRAAKRVSERTMLSGSGVYQLWKTSGLIDGAIDTEAGPISFEGGKLSDRGDVDIQSGPVAPWEAALIQVDHAIEVASDSQKPSRALVTLTRIWDGIENTTGNLLVHGQHVWSKIDPSDQTAILGQLPTAFKDQLALHVTGPATGRCGQSPETKQIDHPWLVEAIQLEATGRSEESLDIIFDTLDDWLLGECLDRCSSFLDDAPVDELSTAQLLTILTATLPACTKLPARATFFDRVREMLRQRGEDTDTLLSGLDA